MKPIFIGPAESALQAWIKRKSKNESPESKSFPKEIYRYTMADGLPFCAIVKRIGDRTRELFWKKETWTENSFIPKGGLPLYRLCEIPKDGSPLIIAQSEADVDLLRELGFNATYFGIENLYCSDREPLKNRDLLLLGSEEEMKSYAIGLEERLLAGERFGDRLQVVPIERFQSIHGVPQITAPVSLVSLRADLHNRSDEEFKEIIAKIIETTIPNFSGYFLLGVAYRPFPTQCLPPTCAEFVEATARSIGCSTDGVALPLLAALAGAIGSGYKMRLKGDWCEPAILWTMIIGDPGQKKSPPFTAVKHLFKMRETRDQEQYAKDRKQFEADLKIYQKQLSQWKREGEGNPPTEPIAPSEPLLVISDATVEAVISGLVDNPRGLLLMRDELAGWLASYDQYKSGKGSDKEFWIECHNGGDFKNIRKISGTSYVPNCTVSITGTIQPEPLRRHVEQSSLDENGLLARFYVAHPPAVDSKWTDYTVPFDLIERMQRTILRLEDVLYHIDRDDAISQQESGQRGDILEVRASNPEIAPVPKNSESVSFWFDEEALSRYKEMHNWLGAMSNRFRGPIQGLWSKQPGRLARLALILYLTKLASGDIPKEEAEDLMVDLATLQEAFQIVVWFMNEAHRIYPALLMKAPPKDDAQKKGADKPDDDTDDLLALITRVGGKITASQLTQQKKSYRGKVATARDRLQELAEDGFGTMKGNTFTLSEE